VLSEEQFGLYALAITAGAIASVFRDGGTRKILIQRGAEYEAIGRGAFQISLLFNALSAGLLAAASPLLARFFDAPGLTPLLWVVAGSILLSTLGTVQSSKLAIDMRFRTLAVLGTSSALLRQLSSIAFALMGFGAMSFVLPLLLTAVFDAVCSWILVGRVPRGPALNWPLFKELFLQSRWVMIGAFALSLILQGDYLAVGRLEDTQVLGIYFFAFQLTASVATLFTTGMDSVLLPTMAKLKGDQARQANAFRRTLRVLTMAAAPCSVGLALVSPVLISLLWRGKWDAAIAPAQILSLSIVTRLLVPAAISLIESHGRWKLRSSLMLVDGAATVVFACIGAYLGGALSIAAWVSIGGAVMTLMYCAAAGRVMSLPMSRIIADTVPPMVIAAAAGAGAFTLAAMLPSHALVRTTAAVLSFMLLFLIGAILVTPHRFIETICTFRRRQSTTEGKR
jgi:PST family polysaccharide transporter